MANEYIEPVNIFDDFDEADAMVNTFCEQVSENKYQEDTRSETDKALGELCLYLDQNPDVYSRVLRKRKQEEMEAAGVISFVKSKMMSLLHGERYPQCLVTTSECIQGTNALKAGMCKTFQLSQELKGNVTRVSSRLAAKRQAKMSINKSPCDSNVRKIVDESELTVLRDKTNVPLVNHTSDAAVFHSNHIRSSELSLVPNSKGSFQKVIDSINSQQIAKNQNIKIVVEEVDQTNEDVSDQPPQIEVSQSMMASVPPPPPPLPVGFTWSKFPKNLTQEIHQVGAKNSLSLKQSTPEKLRQPIRQERRSSPRTRKVLSRANSVQDLPLLSQSDTSTSSPFLTPELPTRHKTHKRTQSSSSGSSISSWGSYSSVHSEIMSTNPISRLKATQIVRSPGGTPARQSSAALPAEPFHKAIYTALKSRFRNVNTPSPRSGNSTINISNKSLLNNTFSP